MGQLRLTEAQARVVHHAGSPLLVVAGPGSGKTRVLTERIRYLLTEASGNFRVLALTFTNKAANEMIERLEDVPGHNERVFIGTMHGFCLNMLQERGKSIGVEGTPQIFEQRSDRRQILLEAAADDPLLAEELRKCSDKKEQNTRVNRWLDEISIMKAQPISRATPTDELIERLYAAYNAGLRAAGGYDFDDLLLLAYELLTEFPKIANFYQRVYRFICIDEAQDLNEAQYAVLLALCGNSFSEVMLVGDPKQSIYGFTTASPRFMERFEADFGAQRIELSENFRCSKAVVQVAQALQPGYMVEAQLPIPGEAQVFEGASEEEEAETVVAKIEELLEGGHSDIEGQVTPDRIGILGRTRYALRAVETELGRRSLPYFKKLTASAEFQTDIWRELFLGIRLIANPRDVLHFRQLLASWNIGSDTLLGEGTADKILERLRRLVKEGNPPARAHVVVDGLEKIGISGSTLRLEGTFGEIERYADTLPEEDRVAVREDLEVMRREWDNYLRGTGKGSRTLEAFMTAMALGTTQQPSGGGIALLTVHSAKGMEFDVVFCPGMAEGVFPDYRAVRDVNALAEEKRNAFVATTRSKRLIYFSYSTTRVMPWGDVWSQKPSRYLKEAGLVS